MLTIKNLRKTYKTKGGVEVKALDDVSIDFPETGMVFLLGKSGSGKSTLLNVCGGLDTPDSGEIIVMGRSSKTFSGSDFDSYRNTFVGFIFQEYNILNEFTVEENLSIALELQGKNKNKQKVAELLEQVDLQGFAKRKPNTLSGGQKQRIAIARALIKEPKIIMADEPTGALDSTTGKQVLDTLKKLSETRLIIVVSHDREFAEIYGDRIIELKDGKIISDVSKTKQTAKQIDENISLIDNNTLSIKSGAKLSSKDLAQLNNFISNTQGNIIISNSPDRITSFKKANRIDENGSTECFNDTQTDKIKLREYSKEESSLIRSKLPVSKAVRMGASSLKVKPFRLIITILLAVVAFLLFGVFSTMMTYNYTNVMADSFAQSSYDTLTLKKYYNTEISYYDNDGTLQNTFTNSDATYLSDADFKSYVKGYGNDVIALLTFSSNSYGSSYFSVSNVSSNSNTIKTLQTNSAIGFGVTTENSTYRTTKLVMGDYPKNANEVAISQWYYTMLKNNTFTQTTKSSGSNSSTTTTLTISSEKDVIGKTLTTNINGSSFDLKITGIYNAGTIPDTYDGWDSTETDFVTKFETDATLLYNYNTYLEESLHRVFLVSDGFYANVAKKTGYEPTLSSFSDYNKYFDNGNDFQIKVQNSDNSDMFYGSIWGYRVYNSSDEDILPITWLNGSKTQLTSNQIVIPNSILSTLLNFNDNQDKDAKERWAEKYGDKFDAQIEKYRQKSEQYKTENTTEDGWTTTNYTELGYAYMTLYNTFSFLEQDGSYSCQVLSFSSDTYGYTDSDGNKATYTYQQLMDAEDFTLLQETFIDYLTNYYTGSLTLNLTDYENTKSLSFEIVGYYIEPQSKSNMLTNGVYISSAQETNFKYEFMGRTTYSTNYKLTSDSIYSSIILPYDKTEATFKQVATTFNNVQSDDSFFNISCSLVNSLSQVDSMVSVLLKVFMIAGIVLAVFSALLLYNFISVSINSKSHEIGVLRAVGARGWDVFKIFFAESIIITIICLILSLIGCIAVIYYLNSVITEMMSFSMSLFIFGPLSLLMMLGIAIVVAFLGTFLPVFNVSRKKPVDSMRRTN